MPQTQPLVSVIIPVFKARPFLAACLQSILGQTYTPIEIIAVEDGPPTHADIIKSFPGVIYLTQAKAGPAVARNLGIEQSHGTYISFLDCDDLFTPSKTALQVQYLQQHPTASLVTGLTEEFLEPGTPMPPWVRERALQGPHRGISPGVLMVRRSLFSTIGLFDTSLIIGSDMDWVRRLKKQSISIPSIATTVLRKRIHGSNQSSHQSPEEIAKYHQELLTILRP